MVVYIITWRGLAALLILAQGQCESQRSGMGISRNSHAFFVSRHKHHYSRRIREQEATINPSIGMNLLKKQLFVTACILFLTSCGDFMTGMAGGMYGYGTSGYGLPYYLQPNVAAQNAVNQMKSQMNTNINWQSGSYVPVTTSGSVPVTTGGSTTGSSTPSTSSRVCVTCHGGGKCNGCNGTGKRTDNQYGTGRSSTISCGVCGGNGICIVCKGSGHR